MLSLKTRFSFLTLFILSIMSASSQQPLKNYESSWKKTEDFVKKGLPKSALTEVQKIYQQAKKDKQDAQVIKSLVYIVNLGVEIRDTNEIYSIGELEKEIASSSEPAASILSSLLAGIYYNYYANHRYEFYRRTETVDFVKKDIRTWGIEDFHRKISELYLRSIQNEKLLQQTRLQNYDAIILKGNMRHLRPTLFDLLAHRALQYFENDERDIRKPAYAFEINQAAAFDPAADFIQRKFETKDSLSLQQKALLLYQRLIAFHLHDAKPDALIDVDIARLQFVNRKSVHPDKQTLYFNALNHIARQYENIPAAAQAWYLLAVQYNQQAEGYKPYGDSTHRLDRVKAKDICEKVLAQKDSSEGRVNCYNLLNQIKARELHFDLEKVNIPNKPFRTLLQYRNLATVYLRLIKVDDKIKKVLSSPYGDQYWPTLFAANPVRNWQQALPASGDYLDHQVELKVDALPAGEYVLMMADGKDVNSKNTLVGARMFYNTIISFVGKDRDYFILDRDNGQPLKNASVTAWNQQYDYKTSKYKDVKVGSYTTNQQGYVQLPVNKEENNRSYQFKLDISYASERLFMDDYINDYYYYREERPEEKPVTSVFLFTDRGLYRPGQMVYFKGIVLTKTGNTGKGNIIDGYKTTIYLRDANDQEVDSLQLETNEFGSFSGKFQLPAGGLNGAFSLYTKGDLGNASFQVEEYKRPKFYVEYEKLLGTYQVNDKIHVTGVAKAYAGNNIDGAIVRYRVVREARFIYPWLFWRSYAPPSQPMEIVNGETKTGKDGKFVIDFTAIPDLKLDRKFDPVFNYTIYADVTDINGETRSGEQSVSVGYKSLLLNTSIPESISIDSLKSITVRTENMNGAFEPARINVRFTRLKEEQRLIRARLWERPDQFIMSKTDYVRDFPNDEYDNETNYQSWEKGQVLFDGTDSTRETGKFPVTAKWTPGIYLIEINTTDKNGEEVKDMRYLEIFDEKSNQLTTPKYLWADGTSAAEPGEKARVRIGSSADNLYLVQDLERMGEDKKAPQAFSFERLSQEKKQFEFPVTEADRGGFGVSWLFIKHNRVYQHVETISVPWTNKELAVEYASFRDKTLPGSEEKWKIRISGYRNEKVAAEILGSMYDASLDQFYPFNWNKPYIWTSYYSSTRWSGDQNFTKVESMQHSTVSNEFKAIDKRYDFLFSSSQYGLDEVVVVGYGYATRKSTAMREALPGAAPNVANQSMVKDLSASVDHESMAGFGLLDSSISSTKTNPEGSPQIRKNFNETAFFLPELRTDSTGAIEFTFTMPEALTRWKFQALAHTKDLAFGYSSREIVTQKQLMVQPNPPRFLREGDKMQLSAKIVNMTDKELTGQAELILLDAATNEPVDARFRNVLPNQYFTVAAGQSESVLFPIEVPNQFNKSLVWRIVAKANPSDKKEGTYSDGEEAALPVLTNRMLVTESLPMYLNGAGTKEYSFDKLLQSGNSETLQSYALTVEYTSNPAWYAIQALPYLMEYPYECAEQTWNRYYANSLGSFIANSSPRIKRVFEQWKGKDTAALLSNLQKNPELKAILLEETPWVLQAKQESEQKKNIAMLFDMLKMSEQLNASLEKLKQLQSPNGGFVWFKGGPDDRYMTQYIVTGIGHLKKLKALTAQQESQLEPILKMALPYLDRKIKEDYDNLVKSKTNLKKYTPGYSEIQYLYMRSFFPDRKIAAASQTAFKYYLGRLSYNWTQHNKYMQGMVALSLFRNGNGKTAASVLKSLSETSISNEELGRYWKDASRGWWWYEAPIERQALLIEAFQEIGKDTKTVNELRTWLLKNKQTNSWESTRATAEACYALLLQGSNWINAEPMVKLTLGNTLVASSNAGGTEPAEAGTGYFKKTINGEAIKPSLGKISLTVSPAVNQPPSVTTPPSWGAVYWQYFEDLDKITPSATPLRLVKKLFIEKSSDRGPVLTPVNEGDVLKVGDKIKVRVELRVDRDMEYVHMKDMRASSLEPVNVISGYKWQGGLGYYESTKDASTNFFFSSLRKGTYVFEYPLFVTHTGNFSNGVTSIQCMYAPEFSAHSEGIRINVE